MFILNKTQICVKYKIPVMRFVFYLPFFVFVVGIVTKATADVVVVVGAGISVSRYKCFTSTQFLRIHVFKVCVLHAVYYDVFIAGYSLN